MRTAPLFWFLAANLFGVAGFWTNANAQECGCSLPQTAAGVQLGEVRSATGSVMASLPSGFGAGLPLLALRGVPDVREVLPGVLPGVLPPRAGPRLLGVLAI